MSKKFKYSIKGTEFQLPISQVRDDSYNNEKYIYMNAKSAASVIKQYVKQYYPDIKVWATSDVYSGGSSVRVNVSNKDGSSVDSITIHPQLVTGIDTSTITYNNVPIKVFLDKDQIKFVTQTDGSYKYEIVINEDI